MKLRDRIKDLRRIKASDLLPNPKNWRTHPAEQRDALRGVLAQVGIADALLARETPGGLMLIDGHARAEEAPDAEWPVLVLDVTEAEADLILATLDPLAAMAEPDPAKLDELMQQIDTGNEALQAMLAELAKEAGISPPDETEGEIPDGRYAEQYGVIVMCEGESHQKQVYEELAGRGYNCKVVTT